CFRAPRRDHVSWRRCLNGGQGRSSRVTAPESRAKARSHLRVAKEYLEAARQVVEVERHSPAVSLAITSGINAKDAICLMRTGKTSKSDNHATAVRELSAALGPAGKSEV